MSGIQSPKGTALCQPRPTAWETINPNNEKPQRGDTNHSPGKKTKLHRHPFRARMNTDFNKNANSGKISPQWGRLNSYRQEDPIIARRWILIVGIFSRRIVRQPGCQGKRLP